MAGISSPGPGYRPQPRPKSCGKSVPMLVCGVAAVVALFRLAIR